MALYCVETTTPLVIVIFFIDPKSLKIVPQNIHAKLSSLGVTVKILTPGKELPHPKALEWK